MYKAQRCAAHWKKGALRFCIIAKIRKWQTFVLQMRRIRLEERSTS
jgi:hypothetical protein